MKWPCPGVMKSGTLSVFWYLSPNFSNGTVLEINQHHNRFRKFSITTTPLARYDLIEVSRKHSSLVLFEMGAMSVEMVFSNYPFMVAFEVI